MLLLPFILFWSALLFYNFYWKRRNLPPGPTPLPILGNLHTIARLCPGYDAFLQWQKQYGPVYTYWLAKTPIIAITDYKTIKEKFILDGDAYAGRNLFNEFITETRGGSLNGIIMTEGDVNKENRRFALQALREIGMGKSEIESKILDEAEYIVEGLMKEIVSGIKEHDILKWTDLGTGSVINQMVFGYRFSGENEAEFTTLKHFMGESQQEMTKPMSTIVMMRPSLRKLPFFKRRNLPPGPTPLPILGNLHTIARLCPGYDAFLQWQKQYGPVYTYWLAKTPIVAITDYKTIKEKFILDGDAYAGRNLFNEFVTETRGGSLNGIIMTEGDVNKENRRFALQALREIGMGKSEIESKILDEAEYIVEGLMKEISSGIKEHDILKWTDLGTGSVINQMVFGYRFSGENEAEFTTLKHFMGESQQEMTKPMSTIVMMRPSLRKLPFFKEAFNRLHQHEAKNQEFLKAQIKNYAHKFESEQLLDSKEALPFVGMYLRAKGQANLGANTGSILFRDDALPQFCDDLWNAGHETTSTTLSFGILYLLLDIDAQSKVQEELDKVVTPEEKVSITHKLRLPYTNAVINIFPEPNRFKPERFLDKNGQLLKVEEFIPFSAGKRICVGESLARMELFLFIANIFHTFKVRPVDPLNPPKSEKINGFVVRPNHYKVRLQPRHLPEHIPSQNGTLYSAELLI